jgi:SNF2 family DNA or RNA helicase
MLTELPQVLLLQIRTGCEGLNLQEYSDVYFVTPHWNPAVEEQAIGRCDRIGQTKRVRVFRFVMNNTGSDGISLDELCVRTQFRKQEEAKIVPIQS